MKLITRKEMFLRAAIDQEPTVFDAVTRIETYLAKIAGEDVVIPEPVTRLEMYLASIAGENVVLPEPITRVEMYLAKKAGLDVNTPEPITREEILLNRWAGGEPVAILKTVSGDIVSVSDALAVPVSSLTVSLEPVQSGSGDPSPDNIRPITGYTQCEVWRTGKNLLDAEAIVTEAGHPSYCFIEDGYLKFTTGEVNTVGFSWDVGFPCPVTFTLTCKNFASNSNIVRIRCELDDGTRETVYNISLGADTEQKATVTIGTVGKTIKNIYSAWTDSRPAGIKIDASQIELGSTASDFEPYTAVHISIPLGQTVYGGTVDVVGGKVTVDRAMVDLGSLTWTFSNSFFRSDGLIATVKRPPNNQTAINAICSAFSVMTWTAIERTDIAVAVDTNGKMIGANPNASSLSEYLTTISGVQLCYELATPITIDLTAHELTTLLGQNNIWSDSGDVTMTYYANAEVFG